VPVARSRSSARSTRRLLHRIRRRSSATTRETLLFKEGQDLCGRSSAATLEIGESAFDRGSGLVLVADMVAQRRVCEHAERTTGAFRKLPELLLHIVVKRHALGWLAHARNVVLESRLEDHQVRSRHSIRISGLGKTFHQPIHRDLSTRPDRRARLPDRRYVLAIQLDLKLWFIDDEKQPRSLGNFALVTTFP
jgi:hypothetical protein